MKRKQLYLIILASLIISLIHFVISPHKFFSYEYELTLGQIADKDIIAPFEFLIYKNAEVLRVEQETEAAKIRPVYKVSENLKFNAQKNLDFIVQYFMAFSDSSLKHLKNGLAENGYSLSEETIAYLARPENLHELYNFFSENLTTIFDIGIYPNNYSYLKIKLYKKNKITEFALSRLYSLEEARNKLVESAPDESMREPVSELANIILIENIVIDNEMTNLEKQKARESVSQTIGKVLKNEKIISKNQKVTSAEILKLNSLMRAQKELSVSKSLFELILSTLGVFLLTCFMTFMIYYLIYFFYGKELLTDSLLIVLLASLLVSVFMTILVNTAFELPSLLIPFSFSVLLIAMIFNPQIGLIYNLINLILIAHFLNWNFLAPAMLALTSCGGLIALKGLRKKQEFYPMTLYLLIAFLVINTAVSLIRFQTIEVYLLHLAYGLVSCLISIGGLMLLVPFLQRKLNLATKQILLELLDFENPLLKKMSLITPGTYHHALIVGNLAESAAEAIGANHLLARVGSYYHDIGKIDNPKFFIENNPEATELHDNMMANESAILIRRHIEDGVRLARKYKLPYAVIDIIEQHHGTNKISYFLNKAQETNLEIDPEEFYYKGPKPRSKEAAIVMIADIFESTTKSLDEFDEQILRELLDEVVLRLIQDNQLDEAPITMQELKKIKEYMLPIIMGVYRRRLEYPEHRDVDN